MHSSSGKKKKFFAWMRVVLFLACLVAVCSAFKFALMPPSYARVIIHEMNKETDKFDCIVLGASHGRSGINPYKLDEELSCNALNVCIPNETIKDSYYLLKEAVRHNDVKTVILDLDYQYWYNLKENNYASKFIYDQLEFSPVKIQYFFENLLDEDFRVALTRWAGYTYLYGNMLDNIKTKLSEDYRNYGINSVDNSDAGGPYVGKGFFYRESPDEDDGKGSYNGIVFDESGVDQDTVNIFRRIVKYCKKKGIRLVCVTSPITPAMITDSDYGKVNEFFEKLCAEENVEFYDFNFVKDSVLEVKNENFVDYDGHMAGELADRYSAVLGSIIKKSGGSETQEVEAREKSVSDSFYSSYEELSENMNTVELADMEITPSILGDGKYAVSIDVKLGGGKNTSPEGRIVIKDIDSGEILEETEYSKNKTYYFEFDRARYISVYLYARNSGSSAEYDTKCKKRMLLNDDAINKYNAKKAKKTN